MLIAGLVFTSILLSGLLDLATAYCEDGLKYQCQRLIREGINEDNAAILYAAAIKYQADVSVSLFQLFTLSVSLVDWQYYHSYCELLKSTY